MKAQPIYRLLFASLMVVGLLLVFGSVRQLNQTVDRGNTHHLKAPPFVGIASAASNSAAMDIGTRLDQEAGISAYFKSPDAITLGQVRGLFRTIEAETEDYIIGSVPVPGYLERADSHVYVHRNGWILAYYMRSDPVSKIIDAGARSITTTKLKNVVAAVASAVGAAFTDVMYYDFRYPNATHMMLIAEDEANGNDFTIQLPSAYEYFERGWAAASSGSLWLDGTVVSASGYDMRDISYGSITASQLSPDATHTVAVRNWGAVIILYRVP